jgi:DNA-binding transcriptional LysR family regulator
VQLTEAGRAFVPQARALLEQAQQAARHARDVADGLAGSLQVGFVGTMLYRGCRLLQALSGAAPALRLTLQRTEFQRPADRAGP